MDCWCFSDIPVSQGKMQKTLSGCTPTRPLVSRGTWTLSSPDSVSPASDVTPHPLLAWRRPSWSHVTKTFLTHLLVMLPGLVPAVDPEPLLETPPASPEQEALPPPAACWRLGRRSHWCSALPPPHGPALGSGTLHAVCLGGRAGLRPVCAGRLGSPMRPGLSRLRQGRPHPSCLACGVGGGGFLWTLNPVTQTLF